ncbi:MAG: hypothetical protein WC813_00220 [Patescibacteria group bacterium]|jgi:hypothetical protein
MVTDLPFQVIIQSNDRDLLAATLSVRQAGDNGNSSGDDGEITVLCFAADASSAHRVMQRADNVIRGECSHSDFIKGPEQLVNFLRRNFRDDEDEDLINFVTNP